MNQIETLIDIQYLGNITYYKGISNGSNIIFEQYDTHKKKNFANRCIIAGANGRINLSVPLQQGRSQKTITKDVRISNAENWKLRHWRSIISSYNNSPWFKYFNDDLAVLFNRRFDFLLDWNLACLNWTLKHLKLDLEYQLTQEWKENWSGMQDFRNVIVPDKDQPASKIRYPQVFENKLGFMPDLSILDLLCCEGPKSALGLLKNKV
jgi:hypothetical protein